MIRSTKRGTGPRVLVLASALLALAACAVPGEPSGRSAEDGVVQVGTLRGQPHLYQPYFYDEVAPDGLKFEVVVFDSSPDIKNAVVSGAVDVGVLGVPAALTGVSQGEDITVIASAADGGSGFIANETIDTPADLVGKNVGYPQGSSQEVLLRLTLADAGVDIDDINLVNLPFSDMASGLASGSIDAFLSAELGPSTAQQQGGKEIASPYETPVGRVNIGLITTGELIEEDPQLVQQIVDTHAAAIDLMLEDPDAWAQGLVDTFGLDRAVVDTAIDNIWLRSDLSAEYQTQVSALSGELAQLKIIPSAPSSEAVFDTTFIDETR